MLERGAFHPKLQRRLTIQLIAHVIKPVIKTYVFV